MDASNQTVATPFDDGWLYDIIFERIDYGVDFYLSLAREARGPVLDIGCGTGRILLPCLRAGIEIEGLDLFAPMLSRLKEKAAAEGFQPRLHQAAMSQFELTRRFALIIIPFNAFVHNLTVDDQIGTLQRCREHLHPGGLLAFDGFFPGASLVTAPDGRRELEIETPHPETGLPVRLYDTRTFNRVEQVMHSFCEIEMLDAAGRVAAVHRSKTTLRWVYRSEMELLLRLSGFARWRISGDFDRHPLVKDTDGMIVEAWAQD